MNENKPVDVPKQNGAKLARLNSPLFLWPATAALAVLLYFGLSYLNSFLTHESTDDAFVEGHVVSIAPRISGQVLAVHVLDNQLVRSNDLLVEIDPADYAMTAAQKQSAADAQESNYKLALAAFELMHAKVTTAGAAAQESKADTAAAPPPPARAKADFERNQELRKQNTISQQEFDSAQAAAQQAEANLDAARQKAVADESKINEARAQLNATEAGVSMALAQFPAGANGRAVGATGSFLHENFRAQRRARDAQGGRDRRLRADGPDAFVHCAERGLGRRQFQGIAAEAHETRPAGAR